MPEGLGTLFNLTYFVSVYSQLVEINAEMFEGMDNLERLHLNVNKLTSVPLNTFMKLTKLKYIDLDNNQIEELPNGLFKNNVNLEKIWLYGNKLKFIGSTLFDGLTKLNDVGLAKNICINKRYEGSTAIVQMKYDISMTCNFPTDVILSEVKKNCVEKNNQNIEQQLETKGIKIEQELIKMNQQHKEMTDKMNELKTEQQEESIRMNDKMDKLIKVMAEQQTELLTAIKEQQTDRVENAAMKIKQQEMEEQKQKDQLVTERITKELALANLKLSFYEPPIIRNRN